MVERRLGVCLIGAGRIGRLHAEHIARHPHATLRTVVDLDPATAAQLAERFGCVASEDSAAAIADPQVDAVVIASPSSTHHLHLGRAIERRKPVLCEKPLDVDVARARQLAQLAKQRAVPIMVGFNRRFDRHHGRLVERLRAGEIGRVELVAITSRDPEPPRLDYLANEPGALFKETMIHDLDMARWILGEEPVTVAAFASNLVDPAFAALGEVDTAVAILRSASGKLVRIDNSWRSGYGYDQRIEVLGERGMLRSENVTASTVRSFTDAGARDEPILHFFLDRYTESYVRELDAFIGAVLEHRAMPIDAEDGYRALVLAETALEAARTGRTLAVPAG